LFSQTERHLALTSPTEEIAQTFSQVVSSLGH